MEATSDYAMSTREVVTALLTDQRARTALEIRDATGLSIHAVYGALRNTPEIIRLPGPPPPTLCGLPKALWRLDPCYPFRAFIPSQKARNTRPID